MVKCECVGKVAMSFHVKFSLMWLKVLDFISQWQPGYIYTLLGGITPITFSAVITKVHVSPKVHVIIDLCSL